jgi:hypothetical protein
LQEEMVRITGFAHPDLLYLLKYKRLNLYFDGTFKCVPYPFYQLLVLMVFDSASNLYIPVFYVLTTSKTQWTYWTVLNEILISCEMQLDASFVHCDFEKAMINAIKEQLGKESEIAGCFFHFKQALLRKMKELGIDKNERKKGLEVMNILTVIPHDEILSKGIPYCKHVIGASNTKWSSFWYYFERTWMRDYEPGLWSFFGKNLQDIQNRTNNPLERYNRTLNNEFPNVCFNFNFTMHKFEFCTKPIGTPLFASICRSYQERELQIFTPN